jgi:L-galactose dehydrogenase
MRYCALGRTGLNVSVIGFGASPLGNVFGEVSLKDGREAVQHAISRGVNFFDVSPYYGLTRAEERLGDALIGSRENIVLATKCGRYGANHFDFSSQTITRELENSLRRLRTDRVDLLQAHDIEFGDVDQIVTETIPAMRKLQEQGKVGFVGITSYWPGLLTRVAGKISVDSVLNYCHSNLLMDDIHQELTPYVERSGIALLNASPLHMGLLGGQPPPEWHPAPATVRRVALEVVDTCRSYGEDSAAVALNFCLNDRAVASTFIGMASKAQVNTSCLALDFSPSPGLIATLRQQIAPVFNTTWGSGLEKNWDLCPPLRIRT